MLEIYLVTVIVFLAINYTITVVFKDDGNVKEINKYGIAEKFSLLFAISAVPVLRFFITISLIYFAVWADKVALKVDE